MRKINSLLILVSLLIPFQLTMAQIGINNSDPDTAAILDIKHDSKGILFPRIENSSKLANIQGLFFYATDDNKFYYYNGTDWQCMNPFSSTTGNVIDGGITIENGDVTIQGGDLTVEPENTINGYGTTPIGGIIMWSGNPNDLPAGWELCDGTGTYVDFKGVTRSVPNLKGRFVVGYNNGDSDYNSIGTTGGEKRHKLTANESGLRQHSHLVSGNTNTDGTHKHWARGTRQVDYQSGGDHMAKANWDPLDEDLGGGAGPVTRTDGSHSHSINITSQTKGPNDAINAHENRPPYYVIAYIIRVK